METRRRTGDNNSKQNLFENEIYCTGPCRDAREAIQISSNFDPSIKSQTFTQILVAFTRQSCSHCEHLSLQI